MFFGKPQSSLPPHDAVIDLLASRNRGLGIRSIARELGVSASTAHRRVQQLKEAGWVTTVADLHTRYSTPSYDIEEKITLDPDRPSLDGYLHWMWIEYGTDASSYQDLVQELRTGRDPNQFRFNDFGRKGTPHWPAVDAVSPLLTDGLPTSTALYRRYRLEYGQQLSWIGPMESDFQSLYRVKSHERYRDFIHLLIHLGEELPAVPGSADEADSRPYLIQLALGADRAAVVSQAYGQRVFDAAVIANGRAALVDRLATWTIQDVLPGFTDQYWGSSYDHLQEVEQLRRLDAQLDGGDQHGRALYAHGGGVSRGGVGRGGDALLAQRMHDTACEMIALRDRIIAIPTLEDLINRSGMRRYLQTVVEDSLKAVSLDGDEVKSVIPKLWSTEDRSEDIDGEAFEEVTVASSELMAGDYVLGTEKRRAVRPLRVESPPDEGHVLLADKNVAVPIHLPLDPDGLDLLIKRPRS